jgi:Sulfotransferase domain
VTNLALRVFRKTRNRARLAANATIATSFLTSYPKSGRTWLRFILSNYFNAAADLKVGVDLHSTFSIVPNFDCDPVRGIPAFHRANFRSRIPLILVTHHAYRRSIFLNRPIIFMVRDPRDVLVSAYFHATRHKHRFEGDISEFLVNSDQGLEPLIAYLNGWAEGLQHHRHCVLSYEALAANPESAAAEVLSFLNYAIDPKLVRQAVASSNFQAMRDRERTEGIPAHSYDLTDNESLRMRKGKVGGFSDYLNTGQVELIETRCGEDLSPKAKELIAATGWRIA